MVNIKRCNGNGQAQCSGCKNKGKWNVQWSSFLYEVEGKEGLYCFDCVKEIREKEMDEFLTTGE